MNTHYQKHSANQFKGAQKLDNAYLHAIEYRGEEIASGATGEMIAFFARTDVDDIQSICNFSHQRFAAVQIADNLQVSAEYKASFDQAALAHPGLVEKIAALVQVNQVLSTAKEDFKLAEYARLPIMAARLRASP